MAAPLLLGLYVVDSEDAEHEHWNITIERQLKPELFEKPTLTLTCELSPTPTQLASS